MSRAALLERAQLLAKLARHATCPLNAVVWAARAQLAAWHACRHPDSVRG